MVIGSRMNQVEVMAGSPACKGRLDHFPQGAPTSSIDEAQTLPQELSQQMARVAINCFGMTVGVAENQFHVFGFLQNAGSRALVLISEHSGVRDVHFWLRASPDAVDLAVLFRPRDTVFYTVQKFTQVALSIGPAVRLAGD